jgi:hypothetical protein
MFWCTDHGTYPWVHEDEVHLHECEDHLQNRIDAPQDLVTWWCKWDLKKCPTLQPIVDHGSQSKCWNSTQMLFTMVLYCWLWHHSHSSITTSKGNVRDLLESLVKWNRVGNGVKENITKRKKKNKVCRVLKVIYL